MTLLVLVQRNRGILNSLILRSGNSLFSATYHVGTQNSCYLRTYFLLVPHDQAQGIQNRNLVGT
jgi:hypothetical protein